MTKCPDCGCEHGCLCGYDVPSAKPPVAGSATGSASGPRYCAVCGEWPAMETPLGLRCHLCECRDYAAAHPVPLPENPDMLRDLASIGVPGAAEKLSRRPNADISDRR